MVRTTMPEAKVSGNVRGSSSVVKAGLLALVGSIAIVALLLLARSRRVSAEREGAKVVVTTAAISAAPEEPAPAPLPPPAPSVECNLRPAPTASAPFIPGNKGDIVPPANAAKHRVFVDGNAVSEGTASIRVDCGEHTIRIGSGGKSHVIQVPCGESIAIK
jgi:hypothetical protein